MRSVCVVYCNCDAIGVGKAIAMVSDLKASSYGSSNAILQRRTILSATSLHLSCADVLTAVPQTTTEANRLVYRAPDPIEH